MSQMFSTQRVLKQLNQVLLLRAIVLCLCARMLFSPPPLSSCYIWSIYTAAPLCEWLIKMLSLFAQNNSNVATAQLEFIYRALLLMLYFIYLHYEKQGLILLWLFITIITIIIIIIITATTQKHLIKVHLKLCLCKICTKLHLIVLMHKTAKTKNSSPVSVN